MHIDLAGAILVIVNISGQPVDLPLSLQRQSIEYDSLMKCVDTRNFLNYQIRENSVYKYDCIPVFKTEPFKFW